MSLIARKKYLFLVLMTVIGFCIDIGTKWWAATTLKVGEPVRVIGDYFSFMLLYNKAAIFGLDPRHILPWFPLNLFFLIFSCIAVVLLLAYYISIKNNDTILLAGLAVILPGALGNMYDRVFFPGRGVVDFIKMGISSEKYWPIYNVADVYVSIGVGLILLSMLLDGKKSADPAAPSAAKSVPASTTNND